jgi:hypothetical protein
MSTGVERWSRQDVFRRAVILANSLVPVREVARQIALEAMNLAHIKGSEQLAHRRRWQTLQKYLVGPKRFLMHENQMVQNMVLYVAQKYERWHEGEQREVLVAEIQAGLNKYTTTYDELTAAITRQPLSRKELVVRYLAALVRSANQNSRDLATAILCLVCNYQAQEAADLHARFIKAVSANYFSKRKSKIMEELHTRFAQFISIRKLPGRATFFTGQDEVNTRDSRLVAEFLGQVVPWGTACPTGEDPIFSRKLQDYMQLLAGKKALRFITSSDQQELIYTHILTCEDCFLKVLQEMNLGCAREHLTLPEFAWSAATGRGANMNISPSHSPTEPEEIGEKEDFMQIGQLYMEHEMQRRNELKLEKLWLASGEGKLPLDLAGNQVYQWAVNEAGPLPLLRVNKKITAIRLIAQDVEGDLVVGVWTPRWDQLTHSWVYRWWGQQQDSVLLATGEKIKFTILRQFSSTNNEEVGIKLRCIPPRRSWRLDWSEWGANWLAPWRWSWQYAVLGLIGVLGVGGIVYQELNALRNMNIAPELINRGGEPELGQRKQPLGNKGPHNNVWSDLDIYEVVWDMSQIEKPEQLNIWRLSKDKKVIVVKLRVPKKPPSASYQWELQDKDQNSIVLERQQTWTQEKGQYIATLTLKAHSLALGKDYKLLLWDNKKASNATGPLANRLVKVERRN